MDPANVTLDALSKRHPERAKWEGRWTDYRLAYRGGFEFLAAAGQEAIAAHASRSALDTLFANTGYGKTTRRFLWQLDGEPNAKYESRWERASYVNYLAAIVDYFRHWLYSQPPQIRPVEQKKTPDWWDEFYEDASGGGMSFIDVARESFLDVLLYRRGGWLVRRKDEDEKRVIIEPFSATEILDWQQDCSGDLEWVTLCKEQTERVFPDDRTVVRIVTYLSRDEWHKWELRQEKPGDPSTTKVEYLGGETHGFGVVPFVMREIPHGLWVADKLFAPCMSLFNRTAMLEYGEHLGCYVQPFMRTMEGRDAESRVLGEGVMLHLRVADQGRAQEEFGWISPDISPMTHLAERLRQDRDELYRSVHQMALAVDSQAQTAVARSGESKIEDRRATEIILAGYGRYELRALVQTANIISIVHGDKTKWVGDGFENFQTSTLDEELQIAALAQAFNIKSPTFNAELQRMIATGRVLPHLDEATKQKIEEEIRAASEEHEQPEMMDEEAPPVPGKPGVSAVDQATKDDAEAEDQETPEEAA